MSRWTQPLPRAQGDLGLSIWLCMWWVLAVGLATATAAHASGLGRVTLDGMRGLHIDSTEVTIAQFGRYAAATGTVTTAEREGGGFEYVGGWQRRAGWTWQRPDGTAPESQDLPAVHLTHAEAQAYCRHAGGRLPTAAEWQQAAFTEMRRSPPAPWVRGTTYPWHTGHTPQGANTSDPDPWPRAAPVTQTRAGVNGLHDMGGNVWEWAADTRGDESQTLGGSWWYPPTQMTRDVQAWKSRTFYAVYIGFRCVYDAKR